jgi:L-amino acid N-acyltransferase YncA
MDARRRRTDGVRDLTIRHARASDAEAMLAIYRPYVTESAVSFELEAPAAAEFAERIAAAQSRWVWLAAESDRGVAGYAYASSYKSRAAYRWSVETAVYVHPDHRGRGVGAALYARLFEALAEKGYCMAYAGITTPNQQSEEFHRTLGFTRIGVFRHAGWKFGRWHDVAWWQRELRDEPPA